jgi:hypothetical protein
LQEVHFALVTSSAAPDAFERLSVDQGNNRSESADKSNFFVVYWSRRIMYRYKGENMKCPRKKLKIYKKKLFFYCKKMDSILLGELRAPSFFKFLLFKSRQEVLTQLDDKVDADTTFASSLTGPFGRAAVVYVKQPPESFLDQLRKAATDALTIPFGLFLLHPSVSVSNYYLLMVLNSY